MPPLIPVTSSNVAAIGYDKDRFRLYVQFRNGSLYVYHDVGPALYDDMFTTSSPGRFVWQELRDKKPYERLA